MNTDQSEPYETEEYKKKRAAQAKKTKHDKEVALAGLVASAQSERLQSRAGLAHLQGMGEPLADDDEDDDDTEGHFAALASATAKLPQKQPAPPQVVLLETPPSRHDDDIDRFDRDLDDLSAPPRRLVSPYQHQQQLLRRKQRHQLRRQHSTSSLSREENNRDQDSFSGADEEDDDDQPEEEGLQGVIDGRNISVVLAESESAKPVDPVLKAAIDSHDAIQVASLYTRHGTHDKPGEFRGAMNMSAVVPLPLTYKESMMYVQTQLHWPPMFQELTSAEALWLIDYLENLWCLRNSESVARGAVQQRRNKHKRRAQMMARREVGGEDDNDDDDDDDDLQENNNSDNEDEDDLPSQFGPGNFRTTRLEHTAEQVRKKDVRVLVYERFGIALDAAYIDTKKVDRLAAGMHAYIAEIGAILMREREREVEAIQNASHLIEAVNPRERCEAFVAALEGKIPNIDNRLKMLQQHVKNARGNLYSVACLQDPHLPRDLPLELKILGLASGSLNTRGKQLEADYAQQQIQMRLGECQKNRWKRFNNAIYEEIVLGPYRTQAYVEKMTIRQWVWHQLDPFSETQEWLQATKTNTVDVVQRYLSNATHTTDYLPELKRDRTQWSFKNGIYTASDDSFWEYGKTYPSEHCPFNRDTVSAKLFPIDFPLGLDRLAPNDIKVTSITRVFTAQHWPEDVITWVWALFGRMFYNVGEHDNWQVAPYFKGLAGTGKSTIVEMFQRIYEPSNVGVLSNNMEEKFGLQTHYDKFIVLGPECRQNFRLDQADFQTMISGERMSIARKNLDTVEINWTAPIMLAGNLYPRWADSGGSVSRRMIPLLFVHPVPEEKSAPDLQAQIDKEMPLIIVKANKTYRAMYGAFSKQNIWNVLPATLKKNRLQMKQETDTIAEFLQACLTETDPEAPGLPVQDFLGALVAWAKGQGYKIPRYNVATIKQELVQQNKRCAAITDGDGRVIELVYGIRLPPEKGFGGNATGAAGTSDAAAAAVVAGARRQQPPIQQGGQERRAANNNMDDDEDYNDVRTTQRAATTTSSITVASVPGVVGSRSYTQTKK